MKNTNISCFSKIKDSLFFPKIVFQRFFLYGFGCLLVINVAVITIHTEDVVKVKKSKSESVSKMKEKIASDLEELLNLSTHTMRHLAVLIDDIVMDVKQLAGQESGSLALADKKCLELYRDKVRRAKAALQEIELQCCLGI